MNGGALQYRNKIEIKNIKIKPLDQSNAWVNSNALFTGFFCVSFVAYLVGNGVPYRWSSKRKRPLAKLRMEPWSSVVAGVCRSKMTNRFNADSFNYVLYVTGIFFHTNEVHEKTQNVFSIE